MMELVCTILIVRCMCSTNQQHTCEMFVFVRKTCVAILTSGYGALSRHLQGLPTALNATATRSRKTVLMTGMTCYLRFQLITLILSAMLKLTARDMCCIPRHPPTRLMRTRANLNAPWWAHRVCLGFACTSKYVSIQGTQCYR